MVKRKVWVSGWDEQDMITWILRAVCDTSPGIASEHLLEVEIAARQHWGGARPYVAKRHPIASDGRVPRTTFHRWNTNKR